MNNRFIDNSDIIDNDSEFKFEELNLLNEVIKASVYAKEDKQAGKVINANESLITAIGKSNTERKEVVELPDENKELYKVFNRTRTCKEAPYMRVDSLLTNAELSLRKAFEKYLPLQDRIVILEKVRLLDIITISNDFEIDRKKKNELKYKLMNKHIDFVIVDKEYHLPICAVELSDYTHMEKERVESDSFKNMVFNIAGLKLETINVPIKRLTEDDLKDIKFDIYNFFSPACPICGAPMIIKESKSKFNKGHLFYSCINFETIKQCKGNISIEDIYG